MPLSILLMALVIGVITPSEAAPPRKRARPPKFPKSIQDVFFSDAREKLEGPRPEISDGRPLTVASTSPGAANSSGEVTPGGSWSKFITAEAVEDEVKAQQLKLAQTVQNATRFKGGEYQQARTRLSMLAAMLAIVAEFDGPIRWKQEAASLRDLVGRAGLNCKVASDASFNEARSRAEDLQTLVRGGSLQLSEPSTILEWPRVADRSALMKRLDQAEQQGITPLVGSERQFEQNADQLLHETQIVAALAEVITRPGYEFADDASYVEFAREMQQQALSLRDATLQGNYEQARQAAGKLGQSCTNCHDGYRS